MTIKTTLSVLALVAATPALAQDDCNAVTFADVGWTDITATTAATSVVLDALATRLAADPLLAPAAVRRFANACCPLEKSPACRAAVLALIE